MPIRKGAYGIVCSVVNSDTNNQVAIKKIANAFDNKISAKMTVREIKLLRHMDNENGREMPYYLICYFSSIQSLSQVILLENLNPSLLFTLSSPQVGEVEKAKASSPHFVLLEHVNPSLFFTISPPQVGEVEKAKG